MGNRQPKTSCRPPGGHPLASDNGRFVLGTVALVPSPAEMRTSAARDAACRTTTTRNMRMLKHRGAVVVVVGTSPSSSSLASPSKSRSPIAMLVQQMQDHPLDWGATDERLAQLSTPVRDSIIGTHLDLEELGVL